LFLDAYWKETDENSPYKGDRMKDVCSEMATYDECFLHLNLQENSEKDILIFNMGILYALQFAKGVTNQREFRQERVLGFIAKIQSMFKGTVVYMNVSPMMGDEGTYERAKEVNRDIVEVILVKTDWLIYDVWNVNNPVMHNQGMYSDTWHFPGYLTSIGWDIILSAICNPTI
jgi:hypothetical protein